jgi:hypothetical protein
MQSTRFPELDCLQVRGLPHYAADYGNCGEVLPTGGVGRKKDS